jgi:hypothetical protein
MLTTNQVPCIAQVSVLPYSMGYESARYLLYQVLYNINLDSPFNKQSIKSEQDNKYKAC